MKKELVALVLSIVMAASGICAAPAYAAETTIQETANVQEESVEEQGVVEGTDDVEPEDIDVPDEQSNEGQNTDNDQVAVDTAEVTDSGQNAMNTDHTDQVTGSGKQSVSGSAASASRDNISGDDDIDSQGKVIQDEAVQGEVIQEEEILDEGIQDKDDDAEIQNSRETLNDSAENGIVHSGTCENCTWSLYEDGTLYIEGSGRMDNYDHYSSYSTNIAPWEKLDVKKVIIGEGITSIGHYAFYNMSAVTSVELPESVTEIGQYAFGSCKSLKTITLPENLAVIQERAFNNSGLESITIPGSVNTIMYNAFYFCTDLESVTIRDGVTVILGAFTGCTSLKNVTIPKTVTRMVESFQYCSSLQTLSIPASVTSIESYTFRDSGLSTILFCGPRPKMSYDAFKGVECTAYYPSTWDSVPTSTEFDGNVTWIPSTEIPSGETNIKEGYTLDDVSNVEAGIQITMPSVLEDPETCPDGIYLLRKEEDGEFETIETYSFGSDGVTKYAFATAPYVDKSAKCSKKYTYALQLFKGIATGEIGPEKEIIRNWLPDINIVISCDMNRFPIHVANNDGIDVSVYFQQGKIPVDYTIPSEDTVVLGSFNGSAQLQYNGSVIMSSKPGSILISEDKLTWSIGMQELMNASLPADAECLLCICDKKGNKITEYPIKTSFERLSFCNRNKKEHESEHPGTRVLDEQLFADELTIDFFGRKQGKYLIDHCKEGEPLGFTGLCFGMVVATDQFQAGLLSAQDDLNQRIVDLADQQFNFVHGGQHGTNTLLDLVKRQHLYQYTADLDEKLYENQFDFIGLLDVIDDYRTGKSNLMPVIWIDQFGKSTHTILAYDYERYRNTVRIFVYEPGDPYRVIEGLDTSPFELQISGYPSEPSWNYPIMGYKGKQSESISGGCYFSWFLPDWDIFSNSHGKERILASFPDSELTNLEYSLKALFSSSDFSIISEASRDDSILAWLSGDGEVDLTGVCSGLTLVGSDYEYTVEGAQSLIFDLETEEGGTASRVKSVTVGGDADTVITYKRDGETDTKTFVKRLSGDDTLITVESSDPDGSTDWSEVSSNPVDDGEQQNGISWSFDGETLTVSGEGDIPDYDSFRDTPWYNFRNRIKKVVIGEGIVRVGNGAFCGTHGILYQESDPRGHDSILEVEFPSTLKSIGDSAFENCNQLKVVKLPQAFSGSIGKAAFHNCFSITTLELGTNLSEIGEAAFKGCTRIESVTIPASVKTIADGYGMESNTGTYLATVIPNTGVFDGCKGLKKVIYKSNADVAARMFAGCISLTEVDLAGSPGEIGAYAFYNGKSLSNVKIPSSMTTVSEGAFDKCDVLADVHYGGSREKWGKVSILTDNEALQKASIHYAEDAVALGKTTRGDMFNLANNVKVTWKEVPGEILQGLQGRCNGQERDPEGSGHRNNGTRRLGQRSGPYERPCVPV